MEQLGQQVIRLRPRGTAWPSGSALRVDDFWPRPQTRLLILQATPFCNIDCSYCYLPQRNDRSRMTLDTVRMAAERLREDGLAGTQLSVVWHAGEPLVVAPAWYEEAFGVIDSELGGGTGSGTRVSHAMQTNATLIDAAWCRFFARHGVAVGVSVDGPAALHDRHRRTRRGGGTHAQVQRGMSLLREHGVPFHAIAVVGAATLADPDGFYDWFEAAGVSELGCNFDEAEGVHAASSLAAEGQEEAHARFMARLVERSSGGSVVVRELAAAKALLQEPLPRWGWRHEGASSDWPDNTQAMPLALITVGHSGDFGTFSPELLGQTAAEYDNFAIGNVHRGGYVAALQGEAFARLWHRIARGLAACETRCAYFDFCGGGAPANKWYELGDFAATETLHCRTMLQRPFDAVLRQAEALRGPGR